MRVHIVCEDAGQSRTKACPDFLSGFVRESPLLLEGPRAVADVILYFNVTRIANDDRVHLRFVSEMRRAPHVLELDSKLNTRATDDEQRDKLRHAFLRGVALYVAARHPEAVTIALGEAEAPIAPKQTSPFGTSLQFGGYGNWRGRYASYQGYANLSGSIVTPTRKATLYANADGGISRSPPLVLDDGTELDLNTSRWVVSTGANYIRVLNPKWSARVSGDVWKEDRYGQFDYGAELAFAVERDFFAADDPRGNLFAVAAALSYRIEGYNFPNELSERDAHYPNFVVASAANFRRDKVTYGMMVVGEVELDHFGRRYSFSGSPSVQIQLGDHIDISLSVSATAREIPEPLIPDDDYQAIGRGDYAAPFSANTSIDLNFHWDRSNGVVNNRFSRF